MSQNNSDNPLTNPPNSPKRHRKSKRGTSLKEVNLKRAHKKLLNILDRDINHLLLISREGELKKDQSQALVNYLKLLREFQKEDKLNLENMTDEELERIASKA